MRPRHEVPFGSIVASMMGRKAFGRLAASTSLRQKE
jgi:hypothetical protein